MTSDDTVSKGTRAKLVQSMTAFRDEPTVVHLGRVLLAMREHVSARGYTVSSWLETAQIDSVVEQLTLSLSCRDEKTNAISLIVYPSVRDESSIIERLQEMVDEVAKLRSHDEHMRLQWYKSLKEVAEDGERLGVGMEYVRLLQETAKRIASNALTLDKETTND